MTHGQHALRQALGRRGPGHDDIAQTIRRQCLGTLRFVGEARLLRHIKRNALHLDSLMHVVAHHKRLHQRDSARRRAKVHVLR